MESRRSSLSVPSILLGRLQRWPHVGLCRGRSPGLRRRGVAALQACIKANTEESGLSADVEAPPRAQSRAPRWPYNTLHSERARAVYVSLLPYLLAMRGGFKNVIWQQSDVPVCCQLGPVTSCFPRHVNLKGPLKEFGLKEFAFNYPLNVNPALQDVGITKRYFSQNFATKLHISRHVIWLIIKMVLTVGTLST